MPKKNDKREKRLAEIRERLAEYKKHCDVYPIHTIGGLHRSEEMFLQNRRMEHDIMENMEFLFNEISRLGGKKSNGTK